MRFEKLTELIDERITGEWGQEPNSSGVKVIRTTNFTNEGKLDLSSVVEREIEEKKIEKKALRRGDIIIEKSGGGPTQPVGRVVYFDVDSNEKYLCNNFTAILRPKSNLVNSKYLLYQMLQLHKSGRTRKYQNKTTGIHNLNLDKYLQEKIALPPLPDQLHIANLLSKAETLIAQRKESIRLLDEFLKSTFLEMFGDPVRNEKGFEPVTLGDLFKVSSGDGLTSDNMNPSGKHNVYGGNGVNGKHDKYMFDEPQIVIGRVGFYCGAVHLTEPKSWVTDNALYIRELYKASNIQYLKHFLTLLNLNRFAGKAAQPLISGNRLYPIKTFYAPIELQTQFAQIVEKTEALKTQYQQSLQELENLYASLSQKAFKGELTTKTTSPTPQKTSMT